MRDTKLQKKLAREAAVRKTAEAALRASVSGGSGARDVLGLATTATAGELEAHNDGGAEVDDVALGEATDTAGGLTQRAIDPLTQPTQTSAHRPPSGELAHENEIVPRGPRQRRGPKATTAKSDTMSTFWPNRTGAVGRDDVALGKRRSPDGHAGALAVDKESGDRNAMLVVEHSVVSKLITIAHQVC